jgi:hypothetical protein
MIEPHISYHKDLMLIKQHGEMLLAAIFGDVPK